MECAEDAGIEECEACEEVAVLEVVVVVATEQEEELAELDGGQPPTDGSFGRLSAGSPCVSQKSCDDEHCEEW